MITDEQLRELLPSIKPVSQGKEYLTDCVFCGRKQHFFINKKTHLFHCKICNEEGNEFILLKKLNKLHLIAGKDVVLDKKLTFTPNEVQLELDITTPDKKLPIGFEEITYNTYLSSRGFTKSDFVKYRIGRTEIVTKYNNYVIFPVIEDGNVKGYVARYAGSVIPEGLLRYRNSDNTDFSKLLFGIDEIVVGTTTTAILVEGLIDKNTLDNVLKLNNSRIIKSLATFGKKISDYQIKKLLARGIKRVILIYDYDAVNDMKKYSNHLSKFFPEVLVGFTFKKDINESTTSEILSIFDNLKTPRVFSLNTLNKVIK